MPESTDVTLQKLDTWKNKLLDMGKRKRLLNYHDTHRLWDSSSADDSLRKMLSPIQFIQIG